MDKIHLLPNFIEIPRKSSKKENEKEIEWGPRGTPRIHGRQQLRERKERRKKKLMKILQNSTSKSARCGRKMMKFQCAHEAICLLAGFLLYQIDFVVSMNNFQPLFLKTFDLRRLFFFAVWNVEWNWNIANEAK